MCACCVMHVHRRWLPHPYRTYSSGAHTQTPLLVFAPLRIDHQPTGIALGSIGMLAASHPLAHYVDAMRDIPLALPFVKFAISAPLTYHFIGGLRHLGWDNIILQDYETALLTGKIMLGVTAVASVGLAFVEF